MSILADNAGNTVVSYVFDAYGNRTEENTVYNPFGYRGEYTDSESGLVYLRARMYDPETGRFINEDPARDGLNWYVYCSGNPIMFVDKTGESAIAIAAGGVVLYEAVPYIVAGAVTIGTIMLAEHHKRGTTNPANKQKHQRGQKRKQIDSYGGEKGDARRIPRKDKKK